MKTQKTFLALALLISSFSFGQVNTSPITGNVGIGTAPPANEKLHVLGIIKNIVPTPLGASLNNFQLLNETGGDVGANTLFNRVWTLRDGGPSTWYGARLHDGISVDASFATPHIDTRTWWERDPNDNIQSWGNGANTYLTINNGDVGIGTTTPGAKFEVVGSSKISDYSPVLTLQRNVNTGGYIQGIQTKDFSGTNNWFFGNLNTNSWIVSKGDFQSPKLTILDNGYVGIGSNNPDEKLTVNGTIHATKVKVTTSVPADYVFQKYYSGQSELKSDYTMPTLAEIENFTKKNNHLPNIPSAKEMQADGVDLGEMNNLLLQKVEELTLYAIEQNKKTQLQQEEIERLKAENEQYKSLAERLATIENLLKK